MENTFLWVAGVSLFTVATVCFYFFPRVIAGGAVLALFLGKTDLGRSLRIFSTETGQGDMNALIALTSAISFCWLIVGLLLDLAELPERWRKVTNISKAAFGKGSKKNGPRPSASSH